MKVHTGMLVLLGALGAEALVVGPTYSVWAAETAHAVTMRLPPEKCALPREQLLAAARVVREAVEARGARLSAVRIVNADSGELVTTIEAAELQE